MRSGRCVRSARQDIGYALPLLLPDREKLRLVHRSTDPRQTPGALITAARWRHRCKTTKPLLGACSTRSRMRQVNAGRKRHAMQHSQHLYRSRPARVQRASRKRPATRGWRPHSRCRPARVPSHAPSPRRCRRRHPMRRISGAARAALSRHSARRRTSACSATAADGEYRLAGRRCRAWPTTTTSAKRAPRRRPLRKSCRVASCRRHRRESSRERSCIARAAAASSGSGPWRGLRVSTVAWCLWIVVSATRHPWR